MKKKKVLSILKKNAGTLRTNHHVSKLFLFGSVARNEATAKSDIDLLVEFSSNEVGLFEFLQFKEYLESILGTKVDLVTRDALKSWMVSTVEKDAIRAA